MNRDELQQFIAAEVQKLAFRKVSIHEPLVSSRVLDSISVIDLIVLIEEKMNKKIPQDQIREENLDTVEKITETVLKA
ncbi:MAG: acyl carrier protein [Bacteroidia bacterium]|nr:acyl carrier protein [Bacteroidia bacterium]